MASVVPPLTSRVIQACNNYLHDSEPLNVDYMTKTGVKIMIDQPQTVGADRIAWTWSRPAWLLRRPSLRG